VAERLLLRLTLRRRCNQNEPWALRTERLSFRLIMRRVRQRPFVLEHLAEIAAIGPAAEGGHRTKCSASPAGGSPTRSPRYLPRGSSAELAKLLHHDPAALDFVQAKPDRCGRLSQCLPFQFNHLMPGIGAGWHLINAKSFAGLSVGI